MWGDAFQHFHVPGRIYTHIFADFDNQDLNRQQGAAAIFHPRKIFTQKSKAPKNCAPPPPGESQQVIKLDNGETILLTPLYQEISAKPYFQLASRAKAKASVMDGNYITFVQV